MLGFLVVRVHFKCKQVDCDGLPKDIEGQERVRSTNGMNKPHQGRRYSIKQVRRAKSYRIWILQVLYIDHGPRGVVLGMLETSKKETLSDILLTYLVAETPLLTI